MVGDRRLTAVRRILVTRRNGWALATVLALLGILLGAQPLSGAVDLTGQALGAATRLLLDVGWLLLLLAAAGLATGLYLSSSQGRTAARRLRWLRGRLTTRPVIVGTAAAALLVALVLVVVVVPPRFTANRQFKTASEELKAQSDVRTTLLQGFAALLVLTGAAIGAAVTLRQVRATHLQIANTAEASNKQLERTREGQITDRYTKAVDQLGSEHLDIRLGGIYALERIARDSPDDRATVEEVLTAFVRGHAPWPPPPAALAQEASTQQPRATAVQLFLPDGRPAAAKDTAGQPDEKVREQLGPAADVQAAVTVLRRREVPPGGLRPLDLIHVNLQGAGLNCANLQRARFEGANLQGANLHEANLQDANLSGANLQHAQLSSAKLQGAQLQEADLWRGRLLGANLQGADLGEANLQYAAIYGANLRDANLMAANLQHARLSRANLQGATLIGANLQHAWLSEADLQGANLSSANLQHARLSDANLPGGGDANLQHAWLLGTDLQGAQLGGANLQDTRADEQTRWPAGWDRAQAEARGVRYRD
jgi:uncharacterized protein YjbI with pentapeptide repeats